MKTTWKLKCSFELYGQGEREMGFRGAMPHQTLSQIVSDGKIKFLDLYILLLVGKVSLTSPRNINLKR